MHLPDLSRSRSLVGPPLWDSLMLGCHPLSSGVTGICVTLLVRLSGCFLLLRLVLGAAGPGLPLQPVAQHAELWGRCAPASTPQFWGTGAVPWLCVLLGALFTAAAERKDRCRSSTPQLFPLYPPPHPPPPPFRLSLSLAGCLTHRPVGPRCQASALPHRACLVGAVLVPSRGVPAAVGHRGNRAPPPRCVCQRAEPSSSPRPAAPSKQLPQELWELGLYFCF